MTTSIEESANRMDEVLREIRLVQGDKSWTCRVWVKQALDVLRGAPTRSLEGLCAEIPEVREGSDVEAEIKEFGEKARLEVSKRKEYITSMDQFL